METEKSKQNSPVYWAASLGRGKSKGRTILTGLVMKAFIGTVIAHDVPAREFGRAAYNFTADDTEQIFSGHGRTRRGWSWFSPFLGS